MTGYKNAPHITPQVGDVVRFEGGTETIEVTSVGPTPPETELIRFINARFINCGQNHDQTSFHLNQPETMILVRTVDGVDLAND